MSNLQEKVKQYVGGSQIPIYLIERTLGLSNNLLGRILDGSVKYPSVENLIKIAKALNCSLDELVGVDNNKQLHSNLHDITKQTTCDVGLFRSCCLYIINYLDTNNIIAPKTNDIKFALDELINCSQKQNLKIVDKKFADWSLSNIF